MTIMRLRSLRCRSGKWSTQNHGEFRERGEVIVGARMERGAHPDCLMDSSIMSTTLAVHHCRAHSCLPRSDTTLVNVKGSHTRSREGVLASGNAEPV